MKASKLDFAEQVKLVTKGLQKGFKYNGCSGVPDFNFGHDCCGEHDIHYQSGTISRAKADRRLRQCIQKKGYIILPWIYWLGVRIFGRFYWKTKQNENIVISDSSTH